VGIDRDEAVAWLILWLIVPACFQCQRVFIFRCERDSQTFHGRKWDICLGDHRPAKRILGWSCYHVSYLVVVVGAGRLVKIISAYGEIRLIDVGLRSMECRRVVVIYSAALLWGLSYVRVCCLALDTHSSLRLSFCWCRFLRRSLW